MDVHGKDKVCAAIMTNIRIQVENDFRTSSVIDLVKENQPAVNNSRNVTSKHGCSWPHPDGKPAGTVFNFM